MVSAFMIVNVPRGILVGQTDRHEVIEECMTMAHAVVRVTDDQTGFGRDAIVTISIGVRRVQLGQIGLRQKGGSSAERRSHRDEMAPCWRSSKLLQTHHSLQLVDDVE